MKLAFLIVLSLAHLSVVVPAAARSRKARVQASDRFAAHEKLGVDAYRNRKYAEALGHFLKAIEIKKKQGLYFNIAQCYRFTGKYEEALRYYQLFYVALDSIGRLSKRQRAAYKKEVEGRMAEMKIKADVIRAQRAREARERRDAEVRRQEAEKRRLLEQARAKREAEAKRHRTQLARERARKAKAEAELQRQIRQRHEELLSERAVVMKRRSFTDKWWFWTGIGTTALFTAGTILFGMKALSAADDWERSWLDKDRDRVKTFRNLTDLCLGGAIVSGLTTAVITLFNRYSNPLPRIDGNITLSPAVTGDGAGLTLTVRF